MCHTNRATCGDARKVNVLYEKWQRDFEKYFSRRMYDGTQLTKAGQENQ